MDFSKEIIKSVQAADLASYEAIRDMFTGRFVMHFERYHLLFGHSRRLFYATILMTINFILLMNIYKSSS